MTRSGPISFQAWFGPPQDADGINAGWAAWDTFSFSGHFHIPKYSGLDDPFYTMPISQWLRSFARR